MENKETKSKNFNKTIFQIVGIILIILLSVVLLWQGNANSTQAEPAMLAKVYFAGEYRIGEGDWQEIKNGEHITSTQGDVTLRGNFYKLNPNGEYEGIYTDEIPIALYLNHVNLTIKVDGFSQPTEHEHPYFGKSACGVSWFAYTFTTTNKIEIVVHNPHNFGNEKAIDEMLSSVALWNGIDFEKSVLEKGSVQRNAGLLFIIASVVFLGTALFSSLIHVKNSKLIWLLGLLILFAGVYITYNSFGISFWSESIVSNTAILGIAMILYMFFLCLLISSSLKHEKAVGIIARTILGTAIVVILALSMTEKIYFYDTWIYWSIIQCIINIVLIGCLIIESIEAKGKDKLIYISGIFPLLAFIIDTAGTYWGIWAGGVVSKYAFICLFVMATIVLIRIIPHSINAVAKAKELESEKLVLKTQLTESRVSTMMSQIRPHFIYNTLGSIEQLCELDPQKAGELVHNFAKYLRGNFGELDNPKPILMSQEMEHVRYYVSIESVRFPDMTFNFEMNSSDFYLPALSIQPIVENAIKHGLMKLQKGGTIRVVTYETNESYCVLVEDDGVGFDMSVLQQDRKHIGIRNIRERLQAMVNGALEITSEIGKGTKVLITIPKEKQQ